MADRLFIIDNDTISEDINRDNHDYITKRNDKCDGKYGSIENETKVVDIEEKEIKVYFYRYIVLVLFGLFSISNSWQGYQYVSINNIITKYYNVSSSVVNLTVITLMSTYLIGVIPFAWLMNHKGMRAAMIAADVLTVIGSIIKCFSAKRDLFWLTLTGQTIVSFSVILLYSLPTRISTTWFEHSKVSFATSICVFDYLLGFALGFLVPPFIVKSTEDLTQIGNDLQRMYLIGLIISIISLLFTVLFLKECPEIPPSIAQKKALEVRDKTKFSQSLKSLLTNKNFIYLTLMFGLINGVYAALTTIINQMVIMIDPDGAYIAGIVGFILLFSGIFSVVIAGRILDKTHHHKRIIVYSYLVFLLSIISYMLSIGYKLLILVYLSSLILSCSASFILIASFEFSVEITYPEPESSSSGIMNALSQVFGLIMTPIASVIIDHVGMVATDIFLIVSLIIGFGLIFLIKSDLRRRNTQLNFANNQ